MLLEERANLININNKIVNQYNVLPQQQKANIVQENAPTLASRSTLSDDDENNSISGEEQRQYQAACIIQKYYRRYKQVSFSNIPVDGLD